MDLIRLFVSAQVCPTEVNDITITDMATVIRDTVLIVNTPPHSLSFGDIGQHMATTSASRRRGDNYNSQK